MNNDTTSHRFGLHAPTYDEVADPQHTLATSVLQLLQLAPKARVADLGCGTGSMLHELLQLSPSTIHLVDASQGMLDQVKRPNSNENGPTILLHRADVTQWKAPHPLNAIVSSAALQWIPDLSTFLACCRQNLQPDGRLVLGTFGPRTLVQVYESYKDVVGTPLPSSAQFRTAQQLDEVATQQGFEPLCISQRTLMQPICDARELLQNLKRMGVSTGSGHVGRKQMLTFLDQLQQRLLADGGCTWELVTYSGTNSH